MVDGGAKVRKPELLLPSKGWAQITLTSETTPGRQAGGRQPWILEKICDSVMSAQISEINTFFAWLPDGSLSQELWLQMQDMLSTAGLLQASIKVGPPPHFFGLWVSLFTSRRKAAFWLTLGRRKPLPQVLETRTSLVAQTIVNREKWGQRFGEALLEWMWAEQVGGVWSSGALASPFLNFCPTLKGLGVPAPICSHCPEAETERAKQKGWTNNWKTKEESWLLLGIH